MNILVTGGAGFIGSNLVHLLIERGHTVLNVDKLTYAGNLSSLSAIEDHANYRFVQADICDAPAMRSLFTEFKPDGVMHLAAESHVDRSIDGPGEFIQTNITGTYVLLDAARDYWQNLPEASDEGASIAGSQANHSSAIIHQPSKKSFRFLHVSTDEVYGSLGETGKFTETTPYDPHSPYSASKASSDHLARAWCDTFGLPVLITNCSNNYGPYQFPEKLIPVVILKALAGEPIPVYGAGENIRDWLYVEDHAEALLTVLKQGKVGETYNVGGNNEMTNIDLIKLLCTILDELVPVNSNSQLELSTDKAINSYQDLITFVTDRPGHDLRYAIDASKIKNDLGWEPKQDPKSGFKKTVQWYLENETWWSAILDGSYKLERLGSAEQPSSS